MGASTEVPSRPCPAPYCPPMMVLAHTTQKSPTVREAVDRGEVSVVPVTLPPHNAANPPE